MDWSLNLESDRFESKKSGILEHLVLVPKSRDPRISFLHIQNQQFSQTKHHQDLSLTSKWEGNWRGKLALIVIRICSQYVPYISV